MQVWPEQWREHVRTVSSYSATSVPWCSFTQATEHVDVWSGSAYRHDPKYTGAESVHPPALQFDDCGFTIVMPKTGELHIGCAAAQQCRWRDRLVFGVARPDSGSNFIARLDNLLLKRMKLYTGRRIVN